ncbi:MAG: LysM peptidoglycan-binding domain-containing protein [Chloroflexi bacterium]|nr:LysM peptidoglycan-binding domain-containing protein [Chloroflexota bacterium]
MFFAVYLVREGDTLSSVAERFGVEVADIVAANEIADPDVLRVGTILTISSRIVLETASPTPTLAPTSTPTPALSFEPAILEGLELLREIQDQVPGISEILPVLLESSITFVELPDNTLGGYWFKDRSITLDSSLRGESRVVVAMVLAHEGLHALDHRRGLISTRDSLHNCLQIDIDESGIDIDISDFDHEIRAFDVEAALWKSIYGPEGKLGDVTEIEEHYNALVIVKDFNTTIYSWLIRLRYLFECVTG